MLWFDGADNGFDNSESMLEDSEDFDNSESMLKDSENSDNLEDMEIKQVLMLPEGEFHNDKGERISGVYSLRDEKYGTGEFYNDGSPEVDWSNVEPGGFVDGKPRDDHCLLTVGATFDRYGQPTPTGCYASPTGTSYEERALPYEQSSICYRKYRVLKPIECSSGIIAPAFDQPGGGIQYQFHKPIKDMLADGEIEEVLE